MSLSLTALTEMAKQESGDIFLILVTLNSSEFPSPIRLVHNDSDITSSVSGGSETYSAAFMDIVLMGSEPGQIPDARIRIDATDGVILAALDALNEQPTVDIHVVMDTDKDTAIASQLGLLLRSISSDLQSLSARFEGPQFLKEIVPGLNMDRTVTPGLFE